MVNSTSNIQKKSHLIIEKFEEYKGSKINQLETLVGVILNDPIIALQALTCSGFAKQYNDVSNDKILDHDGLATLGDAVLKTIIAENLFRKDPSISSGSLTIVKRDLENNPELQSIGQALQIKYLLFSCNNETDGNKKLATAIEAIIGAIYLSNGLQDTKNFVDKYILKQG